MNARAMRDIPVPAAGGTPHRLRQWTAMWLAGMLGMAVVAATVVPALITGRELPLPMPVIALASLVQGGLLLALAVWAGIVLSPRVGLRAPAFEAFARRAPIAPALQAQWRPGLMGGLAGGALLVALTRITPAELAAAGAAFDVPLAARLLYGGITEELLLRWGLMSGLLWLLHRLAGQPARTPSSTLAGLAIALSATLFAAGHLPAVASLVGGLTAPVVAFVMLGNTVFGVIAGLLYWRRGLEAAVIAHGVAHLVLVTASASTGA